MSATNQILLWVVGMALAIALSVGGWYLSRQWNYSWSYESMVEQSIKDNVKQECLK